MGDNHRDPVDHFRTTHPHAGAFGTCCGNLDETDS